MHDVIKGVQRAMVSYYYTCAIHGFHVTFLLVFYIVTYRLSTLKVSQCVDVIINLYEVHKCIFSNIYT